MMGRRPHLAVRYLAGMLALPGAAGRVFAIGG